MLNVSFTHLVKQMNVFWRKMLILTALEYSTNILPDACLRKKSKTIKKQQDR